MDNTMQLDARNQEQLREGDSIALIGSVHLICKFPDGNCCKREDNIQLRIGRDASSTYVEPAISLIAE